MENAAMTETHLVYKLEGGIQEIDVFRLAPTLLALGELIRDSNRELFPEGRDLGVNVKPFRGGSFIVDLTLVSSSHFQQLIDLLTPHSIEQIQHLLECIGLVSGGAASAIHVFKFLKGKPKSIEEISAGEVRYTAENGSSITVNREVHSLLSNTTIAKNIYNIYVPPMVDQPSVEEIKTYSEGHEDKAVIVKRDEIPVIEESTGVSTDSDDLPDTTKDTVHHGVLLNPKRGAFGDDPKDWSFWKGDGIITANIKDKTFLTATASGEVRLNESDLLTVDLLERQKLKGTRLQKPTYDIIKVTDYKKGPTQAKMFSAS
jgi:hypothetical protein